MDSGDSAFADTNICDVSFHTEGACVALGVDEGPAMVVLQLAVMEVWQAETLSVKIWTWAYDSE